MIDAWNNLPATTQDLLLLALLLAPAGLIATALLRGHRPLGPAGALLQRYVRPAIAFVLLIAVSVALNLALIKQENGLVDASARVTDQFDLIVTAQGSDISMLLATVFLQPTDLPLLSGETYQTVANDPRIEFAAPIAFGDSWNGHPIIGTTSELIQHLSPSAAAFTKRLSAVAGANVPLRPGDTFEPAHGIIEGHDQTEVQSDDGDSSANHGHGIELTVTDQLPKFGGPWDDAILVPIETIWFVHGIASGHRDMSSIGPPFDPDRFPGTPGIVIKAKELWSNYALRDAYTTQETLAFFPGEVLSRLHSLLGDMREILTLISITTIALVTVAILTGIVILQALFQRQLSLLHAIGAPKRFIFAIVWSFTAFLCIMGVFLGYALSWVASSQINHITSERTGLAIETTFGWTEIHLTAAILSILLILALIPAISAVHPRNS